MRPHSYPQAGHPEQFGAASAWPVNVTMPDRGGVDAPWAEQEPAGDHAGGDLNADHDDHPARSGASPGTRAAAWRLAGDAIDPAAASEQAPGCGRTRGRCRESSGNGPGVPSATPPRCGSGGGSSGGTGSGSGSGSGLGSGRGRGRGSGGGSGGTGSGCGSGSGGGAGRGRGSGGSGHGLGGGHGGGSGCGGRGIGGRCGCGTGGGFAGSGRAGSGHAGSGWLGSSGTSPA